VQYTGLTQGFVGLAQWNVQIPDSAQLTATGALPIVIKAPSGEVTKTVNIWVK
jgi:uncharacterized protein (TIGR03437 family)